MTKNMLFNGLLVVLGAALLVSTLFEHDWLLVCQIVGIVCLMLGAYRLSIYRAEVLNNEHNEEE